jgi:hypothetical protein
MITFKEFLNETPVSFEGDYAYAYHLTANTKIDEIKDWKKVDTITFQSKKYILISKKESRNEITYKLGQIINDVFMPVFGINLVKPKHNKLKLISEYSNVIMVKVVSVAKELQGKGIAAFMYNYLVRKMNYTIISDQDQFFGARKLWTKLSKEFADVKVDVFNYQTGQIIEKGAIINHGERDDEFDTRYWARSSDIDYNNIDNKLNIRFILKKVL